MNDDENAETKPETRQAYFALAKSWAADRNESVQRSRRVAWIVAGVAAAIAIVEGLALIALTPLKTVVPYTLLVDRNTGFAQLLEGTEPQLIKPDAALTQAQLAQYVIAREAYQIDSIADQYRKVALWSAERARRDYLALMPRSNPDSPLNRFPRTAVVKTEIESVSPMGPQTAMVRFKTLRSEAGRLVEQPGYWVAILRYRYASEPLSIEDRIVNPLGFQVTSYRRDQEAPPPALAARPQAPDIPGVAAVDPRLAIPEGALTMPPAGERPKPRYYEGDGL